jgi:uncharacterized peroxidase-related enzyme
MTFINTIPEQEASGDVLEMYQRLQGSRDYLPNYARVFCHRPELMQAWSALQATVQKTIDHRRYELVTLAAARQIQSSYCSLAHGRELARHYYSEEELLAIAAGEGEDPLDEADRAMMDFAAKVAGDSSKIEQRDVDALKACGFDDAQIFDVTAAAAARCFFAKINDALGAAPDRQFLDMAEPLRALLTVGREIEHSAKQA